MRTLLTRDDFRDSVFARNGHCCVICQELAVDAHHIIERRLWDDGGYYIENGAGLCEKHHMLAETTELSCDDIRAAANIDKILLPPHFDRCEKYDKWGNIILPNGLRVRGELFFDESVQAILKHGNMLDKFTKYVKFPKISHLPWSESIDDKTDRILSCDDVMKTFGNQEVVVTEKMDGENTSMYKDYIHARSLDSRHHGSRDWVKNLHASVAYDIPDDWRICGDGKNDFALFDPDGGKWFVLSSNQSTIVTWGMQWGWNGATPMTKSALQK